MRNGCVTAYSNTPVNNPAASPANTVSPNGVFTATQKAASRHPQRRAVGAIAKIRPGTTSR